MPRCKSSNPSFLRSPPLITPRIPRRCHNSHSQSSAPQISQESQHSRPRPPPVQMSWDPLTFAFVPSSSPHLTTQEKTSGPPPPNPFLMQSPIDREQLHFFTVFDSCIRSGDFPRAAVLIGKAVAQSRANKKYNTRFTLLAGPQFRRDYFRPFIAAVTAGAAGRIPSGSSGGPSTGPPTGPRVLQSVLDELEAAGIPRDWYDGTAFAAMVKLALARGDASSVGRLMTEWLLQRRQPAEELFEAGVLTEEEIGVVRTIARISEPGLSEPGSSEAREENKARLEGPHKSGDDGSLQKSHISSFVEPIDSKLPPVGLVDVESSAESGKNTRDSAEYKNEEENIHAKSSQGLQSSRLLSRDSAECGSEVLKGMGNTSDTSDTSEAIRPSQSDAPSVSEIFRGEQFRFRFTPQNSPRFSDGSENLPYYKQYELLSDSDRIRWDREFEEFNMHRQYLLETFAQTDAAVGVAQPTEATDSRSLHSRAGRLCSRWHSDIHKWASELCRMLEAVEMEDGKKKKHKRMTIGTATDSTDSTNDTKPVSDESTALSDPSEANSAPGQPHAEISAFMAHSQGSAMSAPPSSGSLRGLSLLLSLFSAEQIAYLVIAETLVFFAAPPEIENSMKVVSLIRRLNAAVSRETRRAAESRAESLPNVPQSARGGLRNVAEQFHWNTIERTRLSAGLITLLLQVASVDGTPAFTHKVIMHHGKKYGTLTAAPQLLEFLATDSEFSLRADPRNIPLLVPPKRRTGVYDGGMHFTRHCLITHMAGEAETLAYLREASRLGRLDKLYAAVDAVGATAWAVNQDVLDVLAEAVERGEAVAGLPLVVDSSVVAAASDESLPPGKLAAARRRYTEQLTEVLAVRHTVAEAQLYATRGDRLYFAPIMDFRGRNYPHCGRFNHMGPDHMRALFMFWHGKRLGPRGLWWLKVHVASLYGQQKMRFDERAAWTDRNWDKIMASAEDPWRCQWWMEADKPWQVLAACFELAKAAELPDPAEFVSRIPVHQDGTCNGLQHYAALGRDEAGGAKVNLVPSAEPQDVYAEVLRLVKQQMAREAEKGEESGAENTDNGLKSAAEDSQSATSAPTYSSATLASALLPHLSRKVIKQSVMTTVYGVTPYGMRAQISGQLSQLLPESSDPPVSALAAYTARHVDSAIRRLFRSSRELQQWMYRVVANVSSAVRWDTYRYLRSDFEGRSRKPKNPKRKPKRKIEVADDAAEPPENPLAQPLAETGTAPSLVWTSPIGLPVVQAYRKPALMDIRTSLQTIYLENPFRIARMDTRKQKNAVAPNVVHSLDASHLLMTALALARGDGLESGGGAASTSASAPNSPVAFAAVHDSFWTHACDVDRLSAVLREQFVEMYRDNPARRLREEWLIRYSGYMRVGHVPAESAVGRAVEAFRKRLGVPPRQVSEAELKLEWEVWRSGVSNSSEPLCGSEIVAKEGAMDQVVYSPKRGYVAVLVPLQFPELPAEGELKLEEVLRSLYFFS